MNWDEQAEDHAVAHHTYEHMSDAATSLGHAMVKEGARWQREKLQDDTAVERVAEHLYHQDFSSPMSDHGSWCTNKDCDLVDGYQVDARHLINALFGEGT